MTTDVTTPIGQAALELVRASESASIANHSIRSWLFADRLAQHRGLRAGEDYDGDALFYATVLHDMGLSPSGQQRPDRFEVAGADVAAEFLDSHGVHADTIETVWEAIALHSSFGIASRRGLVCQLCHGGIMLDFGAGSEFLSDEDGAAIHADLPRLALGTTLTSEIVDQAELQPSKRPPASLGDVMFRSAHGITDNPFPGGRWGD